MRVLTIGYGGCTAGQILRDLQAQGATHLVDVRTTPSSRRHPDFDSAVMHGWLRQAGVQYVYLGDGFGGHPPGVARAGGRPIAASWENRPAVRQALAAVTALAEAAVPVLMCAERDPDECHRSWVVAPLLERFGIEVWHILGDGTLRRHVEPEPPRTLF